MSYKKACFTTVVLALAFLMLFSVTRSEGAEKILKVGVMGPYTGPVAMQGGEIRNASTMAFEKIGYKIGDYKVELVWIDSQSDPAKAVNAYSEAVERLGIDVGLLGYHSSVVIALMDLLAKYKIPHFFGCVGSELINEKYRSDPKYKGLYFKDWVIPGTVAAGYVDFLNSVIKRGVWKPEKRRVALVCEDTDWGRSWAQGIKKAFIKSGWEIVSEDYFPLTQTDFYPLVAKYQKLDTTVIASSTNVVAATGALMKQRQELGFKGVVIADAITLVGEWYSITGPASNFMLDMMPLFATPGAKEFAAAYEKKYGSKPGPASGGLSYDVTNFFIKIARRALEKYGKLDRETIHKIALEEVATGKLTYTAKDGAIMMAKFQYTEQTMPDPVYSPDTWFMPILQYENGNGKIVFPENMKEAEFRVQK